MAYSMSLEKQRFPSNAVLDKRLYSKGIAQPLFRVGMSPAYLRHGSGPESPNCHGKTQTPSGCQCVISKGVAIGLGRCGNWPGQRQDLWKYIDASTPHRKFRQVLRPESHLVATISRQSRYGTGAFQAPERSLARSVSDLVWKCP
jgi:hypothetical protein